MMTTQTKTKAKRIAEPQDLEQAILEQRDALFGLTEFAKEAKVARNVVTNWRARDPNFPAPVQELAMGPIFLKSHVVVYLKQRKANKEGK